MNLPSRIFHFLTHTPAGRTLIAAGLGWLLFLELRHYIPQRIRPPDRPPDQVLNLKTTAYCHCGKCCSFQRILFIPLQRTGSFSWRIKWVGRTATGSLARPGTVAADPAVLPFGTLLHVEGYGYARVEDTGGDIKGHHIDLYFPQHQTALEWGVQTNRASVWRPPL